MDYSNWVWERRLRIHREHFWSVVRVQEMKSREYRFSKLISNRNIYSNLFACFRIFIGPLFKTKKKNNLTIFNWFSCFIIIVIVRRCISIDLSHVIHRLISTRMHRIEQILVEIWSGKPCRKIEFIRAKIF